MKYSTFVNGALKHVKGRILGKNVWTSVSLLVTFRCNCQCTYCDFPQYADEELSSEATRRLLAALYKFGVIRLSISGGEPLLRTDIDFILREAVRQGFVTSLVTNGILLKNFIDSVSLVDYVLCTIEGDASVHDSVRGKGAWDAVTNGLFALGEHSTTRIGLICPVHKGNRFSLQDPLDIAEEVGGRVFYQPAQTRMGNEDDAFLDQLSDEDLKEIFRHLAQWKKDGRPIGNSRHYLEMVAAQGAYIRNFHCSAGRYFVTILPDGQVTPCCMLPFNGKFPKVHPDYLDTMPTMPAFSCNGCSISPYIESSLLFSLDRSVLWNLLTWKA